VSHDTPSSNRKTSTCSHCGALNGSGFDRCVRCGHALSAPAQVVQGLGTRFSGDDLMGSKVLILMTVSVFAGQIWNSLRHGDGDLISVLLLPTSENALRFGGLQSSLLWKEPWRLLSAVFPHFGLWHLFANMSFLTWLGRVAEPAIGSARFVLAYLVTGISGFVLSIGYAILFENSMDGVTAGASGAVFGIIGLVLGLLIRQKNPLWKRFAVQAILFQLLVGFLLNRAGGFIKINNLAHLGGLIPGLLFGFSFGTRTNPTRGPSRTELFLNVGAVLGVVTAFITLVLAQRSPLVQVLDQVFRPG
jgi:rhomboid protease GluP